MTVKETDMHKRINVALFVIAWLSVGVFVSPLPSLWRWVAYAALISASLTLLALHRCAEVRR